MTVGKIRLFRTQKPQDGIEGLVAHDEPGITLDANESKIYSLIMEKPMTFSKIVQSVSLERNEVYRSLIALQSKELVKANTTSPMEFIVCKC